MRTASAPSCRAAGGRRSVGIHMTVTPGSMPGKRQILLGTRVILSGKHRERTRHVRRLNSRPNAV